MKLLLDTHIFLWFVTGDERLSPRCRDLIEDVANDRLVSIASIWEMAIKTSIGRLMFDLPFGDFILEQLHRNSMTVVGITISHTAQVATLPYHHRNPFDRLLVAQALVEELPILSVDAILDAYGVTRIWS